MKRALVALAWGMLFGAGLVVSGVFRPQVIQGYLDFSGTWDPTLLITLCVAVTVYAPVSFFISRRGRPLMTTTLALPKNRRIDARLLTGAAMFGAGWGWAGMCPGANLSGLTAGGSATLLFFVYWVAGAFLGKALDGAKQSLSPPSTSTTAAES